MFVRSCLFECSGIKWNRVSSTRITALQWPDITRGRRWCARNDDNQPKHRARHDQFQWPNIKAVAFSLSSQGADWIAGSACGGMEFQLASYRWINCPSHWSPFKIKFPISQTVVVVASVVVVTRHFDCSILSQLDRASEPDIAQARVNLRPRALIDWLDWLCLGLAWPLKLSLAIIIHLKTNISLAKANCLANWNGNTDFSVYFFSWRQIGLRKSRCMSNMELAL